MNMDSPLGLAFQRRWKNSSPKAGHPEAVSLGWDKGLLEVKNQRKNSKRKLPA